jgi:lipopolysaccharide/colanic/teichoic acid biosynthesis glycosyltransferase
MKVQGTESTFRGYLARRRTAWRGAPAADVLGQNPSSPPWLSIVDAGGLIAALVVVAGRMAAEQVDGRLFVTILAASSLYVWFLFSQFKSLETILRRQRATAYLVPTIAAASTLVIVAIAGVPISVSSLLIFVAVWTLLQYLGRAMLPRDHNRLKILLVGDPSFRRELESVEALQIESRAHPPERIQGWDIVTTDPAETYESEWLQWMGHADMYGVKVLSAPLVLETLTRRVPIEMLSGRWAFEVLHGRSGYLFWKRLFDLVAVIALAPVILLVAAIVASIVYFDTGRPVLFWQERVGVGGRTFRMVKFRTMRSDAEENGSAFATQSDSRVTRTGRLLRHYRLDEIPQLWNVLLGEMSIIGPRPEQKGFAAHFASEIPLYGLRSNLRPGITGWAQVMQGYAADTIETETKLRYDFYYVKHCSFALDLRIVWQTMRTILTGFGSR